MKILRKFLMASLVFMSLFWGSHALADDRFVTMYLGNRGQTWANPGDYVPGLRAFTGSGGYDTLTFVMPGAPDGTYLVTFGAFGQSTNFSSADLEGQPLAIQNLGTFYGFVQGQQSLFLRDSLFLNDSQFTASLDGVSNAGGGYTVYAHAELISAVPELETYVLMLAGLGGIGFMTLRNKKRD